MLGQRYLPTSYQKKLLEMDYNKHTQRLQDIKKSDKKKDIKNMSSTGWKTSSDHLKHLQFVANEKVSVLDRENKVLLEKLIRISKSPKHNLYKTSSEFSNLGTLNSPYRKKEFDRIASENEAMAKRLISQQSAVKKKSLKNHAQQHDNFVKNIQKITCSNEFEKHSPVHSPKYESYRSKGFKLKTIKNNLVKRCISEGNEEKISAALEKMPLHTIQPDAHDTEEAEHQELSRTEQPEANEQEKNLLDTESNKNQDSKDSEKQAEDPKNSAQSLNETQSKPKEEVNPSQTKVPGSNISNDFVKESSSQKTSKREAQSRGDEKSIAKSGEIDSKEAETEPKKSSEGEASQQEIAKQETSHHEKSEEDASKQGTEKEDHVLTSEKNEKESKAVSRGSSQRKRTNSRKHSSKKKVTHGSRQDLNEVNALNVPEQESPAKSSKQDLLQVDNTKRTQQKEDGTEENQIDKLKLDASVAIESENKIQNSDRNQADPVVAEAEQAS